MVKQPLHVEFGHQQLTSYSGLELLRYLRQHELPSRLHAACAATGGDYRGGRLARLVLALLYVGARRLEHLRYLAGDPLIARFCGLARIPTARTVTNWLRQFTQATWRGRSKRVGSWPAVFATIRLQPCRVLGTI